MKMVKPIALILSLCFIVACQHQTQVNESKLADLWALMSGEFDSLEQSKTNENYYHISLKMKPIWHDRLDGKWIYVEQAVGDRLDQPYRQRIYHLTQISDNRFSSAVYELPDAQAVVGAYENPGLLAGLSPTDLIIRTGCAVILKQVAPQKYSGTTQEKSCLSQLRGASYATSEVIITAAGISSWDQGFDANDQQVWGATEGPYFFDRK